MWGNRLGWFLAGLLAALSCVTIAVLNKLEQPTPPTFLSANAANLAPLDLPIPPEEAWPQVVSDDRDAGDLYRQTIFLWDDSAQAACDQFVKSPVGDPPAPLQTLLQTRNFRRMKLCSEDLSSVINYDNAHPPLDALAAAGEAACTVGLSLGKSHHIDDAIPYLESAFNLGRNLYNERIVYAEFQRGMQLMADSVAAVRLIEPPGSDLSTRLALFDTARVDYEKIHVEPIWNAIDSADPDVIAANAGDVFVFAENSPEQMWRIEAILKIGRFRFDVNRYGDEAAANRLIAQSLTDPQPAIAAAAAAARDLTVEKYRQLGGPG